MIKIVNVLCVFLCLVLMQGCVTENIIPLYYEAFTRGPLYTMEFPDKLEKGESYSSTFKHPLTDEVLRREIVVLEGDKCVYIEEMPNGGMMICKFSESERIAVAQYYRDSLMAQNVETKYYINGKEVHDPLQEALNCGLCVIEGYGENESGNYFPTDKCPGRLKIKRSQKRDKTDREGKRLKRSKKSKGNKSKGDRKRSKKSKGDKSKGDRKRSKESKGDKSKGDRKISKESKGDRKIKE